MTPLMNLPWLTDIRQSSQIYKVTPNPNRAIIFKSADSWGKNRPLLSDLLQIQKAVANEVTLAYTKAGLALSPWQRFRIRVLCTIISLLT